MKNLLLFVHISFILITTACNQTSNKGAGHAFKIDTLEYPDHFTVSADSTHFFTYPDSNSQRNDLVSKDQFVEVSMLSGDFMYISYKGDNDTAISGWVLKKALKKALITPPVISGEDSTR